MRVVKDTPFDFGYLVWSLRPPKPSLVVVVKGTFTLIHGETADIAEQQVRCTGAIHHDDEREKSLHYDSDFAVMKPHGECFLVGSCHPPAPPQARTTVSFSVGAVKKTLAVYGDRRWPAGLGTKPTEPEPFVSMPLLWERSYGGLDFEANPVGVGRGEVVTSEGRRSPLPNIEDPRAPILSSSDTPSPAGAFPIPPTWKSRTKKTGTYDEVWRVSRWPWFPEDFDFGYFNAAPADQRIEGAWRGDEAVSMTNLVKGKARIESKLPGLAPRCFLAMTERGKSVFREVALKLDTITLDGERGGALCVWRGLAEVETEKLTEVDHVFVMHEPLGAKTDAAVCKARFDELLVETAAPQAPPPVAKVVDEPPPPPPPSPEVVALVEQARESLKAVGIDMDAALVPSSEPMPPGKLDEIREHLRKAYAEANLPPDPALEDIRDPPPAPDRKPANDAVRPDSAALRALVVQKLAAKESLAKLDLTGADLSDLDFREVDLSAAVLKGCTLRSCRFEGAKLVEAVLANADLTGAVLSRCLAEKADLTGVKAEGVLFEGALLEKATLAGADLDRADFSSARCGGAHFEDARLTRARFEETKLERADFTGATIVEATFVRADLKDATLYRVFGARAVFDGADMTKIRASDKAVFTGASMKNAKAAFSRWGASDLTRTDFTRTDLERADFSEAVLDSARLDGCNLKCARFQDANLKNAKLRRSNAFEANFEAADLSHADFTDASLFAAQLWRARTSGTVLERANVARTHLA